MFSLASNSLSRTSSVSSVASDDSFASSSANSVFSVDAPAGDAVKRTRKRFTSVQLMVLEHLYGQVSHPSREQREEVAREADIDIRSVTVWFQNKRQTDRRISRQVPEAPPAPSPSPSPSFSHPPMSPTVLPPPSSPFSDASGNTIHTVRARTRTLSEDSSTSALSAMSRKREREHEGDGKDPPPRHIRHKPSRHLSLDEVAARAERPALVPRTPPQAVVASGSSSSPVQPLTPDLKPVLSTATLLGRGNEENDRDARETSKQRALWENMPSSPVAPDEPLPSHSERDIVRYGSRRRITLEYACARETVGVGVKEWEWGWLDGRDRDRARMRRDREKKSKSRQQKHHSDASRKRSVTEVSGDGGGRRRGRVNPLVLPNPYTRAKEQDEEEGAEEDIPVADYDVYGGGDTDTEGAPSEPPVTPSSSFSLGELHHMQEDEMEDGDSDRTVTVQQEVLGGARGLKKKSDEPMGVARIEGGPDDDLMDVAYVLCGLRQRR
ncbi:hypothetical protein V8D89_006437 [Ganoderma adspersum]